MMAVERKENQAQDRSRIRSSGKNTPQDTVKANISAAVLPGYDLSTIGL